MTTYPCAQCGALYEQGKRRLTAYCPDCRRERHLAKQREAKRAQRARHEDLSDVINEYTRRGIDPDYAAMMRDRLDEIVDEADLYDDIRDSAVEVPLEGMNSAAGPDEGASTYFTDLREELEAHSDKVATHLWWAAHPNWWVDMHDDVPIPDVAYLSAS